MFYYIFGSLYSIIVGCMLIGVTHFLEKKYNSRFLCYFTLSAPAINHFRNNDVTLKTFRMVAILIFTQIFTLSVLFILFLLFSWNQWDDARMLVILTFFVHSYGFDKWIMKIIKKDTAIKA